MKFLIRVLGLHSEQVGSIFNIHDVWFAGLLVLLAAQISGVDSTVKKYRICMEKM